ncbi:hypothetical protein VNO78_32860 [Psophocarpus tetragonolobus]|uniref:C2 domain-containing protein n=1 Tax=Psophocarpus tetragonolobus TaxID=3891 RepID=A0AAN9NWW5_PSOTE
MGSRYEVEVKLSTARGLKNVNWRHGPNRPYVVVWVDPSHKLSTRVDEKGDVNADWDETLVIPLPPEPLEELALYVDVVHAGSEEDTKPLIGSARLKLEEVRKDAGIGQRVIRTLALKRPSGRPQGNVEVSVKIREPSYRAQGGYNTPQGYGYPTPYAGAPQQSAPHSGAPAPPQPYNAPPQPYNAPPQPYNATPQPYNAPPQPYNAPPQPYNAPAQPYITPRPVYGSAAQEKSSFGGMGTGLAVGAVAGALGGIALVEGAEYVEDQIAEDVKERVEKDLEDDDDDSWF